MSRLRAIRRAITLERLLPLAIIGGALILIGSEFTDTFRLEAPGDKTLGLEQASDRHSWAILVLGLCTLAAVTLAAIGGSKPAATATAVFGVAALLLFLLIDLPDAGKVGTFDSPNSPFVQAKAEPEGGFWLLLVGSVVVAICGIALATLSPEQLRSLRPGAPPAPPKRSGKAAEDGERGTTESDEEPKQSATRGEDGKRPKGRRVRREA
jgi:amino acid transporter